MVVFNAVKRGLRVKLVLALVVFLACLSAACESDDLYSACVLSAGTINTGERACAQDAESCVVKNFLRCETRMCGKYNGKKGEEDGFCTVSCNDSDSVCGDGECIEFLPGTGEKYCVKRDPNKDKK